LKPTEKQNNCRHDRSPGQGAAGPMASSRSDWGRSSRWNHGQAVPTHGARDGFVRVALTGPRALLHTQDRLTCKVRHSRWGLSGDEGGEQRISHTAEN
jgi:hypothetical protein